jgi:branched-chain amino acid transport system substrate-binding protein
MRPFTTSRASVTRYFAAWPTFRSLLAAGLVVPLAGCTLVVDTSKREPCTSHAECTSRYGEPSMCVESSCVKLLSQECSEVVPEGLLEHDDVILYGFMGVLRGASADYGTAAKEGAELAFDEIETQTGGIPGAEGEPRQRHVGMLVCDHGSNPKEVARHLVEDVKVPAIIGPSFSGVALKVLEVTVPSQTLLFSPQATSPALTDYDDNGLFWRTCPSDAVQMEHMKFLLADLVDSLRAGGVLEGNADPKISMYIKGDSAGTGLESAATRMQTWANAAPPIVGARENPYPDTSTVPPETVDWSPFIKDATDYKPDIIMALGTSEFLQFLMPRIEESWNPNDRRPFYLLPEGNRDPQLIVNANAESDLFTRVVGTAPGPRKSRLYNEFADHFGGQFDHRQPGNLAEFAYDAAYLLLYATAISGKAHPSGPDLADALTHVSCEDNPVQVGRTGFAGYFALAQSTKCIDFEGASGPLDFDAHGEALSDIATWCLRQGNSGFSYDPPLDTYYSASEYRVIWKNDKPIDFAQPDWCDNEGQ